MCNSGMWTKKHVFLAFLPFVTYSFTVIQRYMFTENHHIHHSCTHPHIHTDNESVFGYNSQAKLNCVPTEQKWYAHIILLHFHFQWKLNVNKWLRFQFPCVTRLRPCHNYNYITIANGEEKKENGKMKQKKKNCCNHNHNQLSIYIYAIFSSLLFTYSMRVVQLIFYFWMESCIFTVILRRKLFEYTVLQNGKGRGKNGSCWIRRDRQRERRKERGKDRWGGAKSGNCKK